MKIISVFLWLLFMCLGAAFARADVVDIQDEKTNTTAGVEFVFSFSSNIYWEVPLSTLTLFVSSEFATSGMVELMSTGEKISFDVQPHVTTVVNLPPSISNLILTANGISKHGVRVTAGNPIHLYASNEAQYSADAFLVLPVNSLGKEYRAAGYNGGYYSSQVAITAVKDDTEITITPAAKLSPWPILLADTLGVPIAIKLNKFQTYLLQSEPYGDLTGTKITSNEPIAVLGAARCAQVPAYAPACDHLVEMVPPVSAWGASFLTYPLATRLKGDLIRVLASKNDTQVKINGVLKTVLSEGTFFDVIQKEPALIETSAPALLTQYSLGQTYDGVNADPFMMITPPKEQFSNSYTFAAPDAGFAAHYVNVVIKTTSVSTLVLDGIPVSVDLFNTIGASNYSGAQIPITKGSHHIKAKEPFGISIYGFGNFVSYGYTGGMKTDIINATEGDYKNVKVISRLTRNNLDIDTTSFTVQPSRIEQLPEHTEIEWNFPAFSIGQIKNIEYEVLARNLSPGEKRTITASTELTYTDLSGKQHRRTLGQQELEVLSSGFTLTATTDKPSYGPGQMLAINVEAANASSTPASAALSLNIVDAFGNDVASINTPPSFQVPAKDSLKLPPINYPIGNLYVGDYALLAQLRDANGAVTETKIPFSITSSAGVQAGLRVTTDKTAYVKKDTLTITNRISNLSTNSQLNEITVNTRMVTEGGTVHWSDSSSLAQISPKGFEDKTHLISLQTAPPGRYSVSLQAVDSNGTVIASHATEFVVTSKPLLDITATVAITANTIEPGQTQTCTYQFNNTANNPITQVFSQALVRLDTQELITETTEEIALPAQQSLSRNTSFNTPQINPLTPGDYACVLRATVNGVPQVLASAQFTVKASPIKLTGNIQLGDKPRLLVLMDPATTADQQAEEAYLQQQLTQAGWSYTLVSTAADFAMELNQGGYGEYALLSETITLEAATLAQLKTNLAAGDGLLVAGKVYPALDNALGIATRSNQAYAKGLGFKQSTLGAPWEHTFDSSSRVINFAATTASVIGEYRNQLPGADTATRLGSLGVASNFNGFIFTDFISATSSVEGRLAAGGNFSIIYYGIGNKLPASPLSDVVLVGGNATFPNGKVYNGNLLAGGSVAGVSNNVRTSLAPGARVLGNTSLPINFPGEQAYLEELSRNLGLATPNGKTTLQYGGYSLKGDCTSPVQVFSLNASELATATSLATNCIPNDATVVFNINGVSAKMQSIGLQALASRRQKVLFNFPQATRLELKYVGVEGSVLAPLADVINPQGNINGQVIAKAWHAQGSGTLALFHYPFTGDLSAFMGAATRNALALNQYQQGQSLFAGFDLLAQASRLNTQLSATAANPFGDLLLHALDAIKPKLNGNRAGKVVPVVLSYSNLGTQAAAGQAQLSLSPGLTLVNPGSFTLANANTWVQPLALAPAQQSTQRLYLKLPAQDTASNQTSAASMQLKLQTGTAPNGLIQFEQTLTLTSLLNP